jgi:non-ribosomal peptide synthetase component F
MIGESHPREFSLLAPGFVDRVYVASPSTFDPFYLDVFLGLVANCRVHFASPVCKANPAAFAGRVLARFPPSFMQVTPSFYKNVEPFLTAASPKYIVLGGERFPKMGMKKAAAATRFYNAYGVTEMSVWQSLVRIENDDDGEVSEWYGRAIIDIVNQIINLKYR